MSVAWESFNGHLGRWTKLSSDIARRLETIFVTNASNTSVAGLMFDADKMEYPPTNPVRRSKGDSNAVCQYHDGTAFCIQNPYISTLIVEAKAAGRQGTRFYLADKTAYDVCLSEPCSQTNVQTGTNRAIYIPAVPLVIGTDDATDDAESDDNEIDSAVVDSMPEELHDMITCPITNEVMRKPVMDRFGHIYEKEAIVRWLSSKDTSPLTGKTLSDQTLVAVHSLKTFIDSMRPESTEVAHTVSSGHKRRTSSSSGSKKMKAIKAGRS